MFSFHIQYRRDDPSLPEEENWVTIQAATLRSLANAIDYLQQSGVGGGNYRVVRNATTVVAEFMPLKLRRMVPRLKGKDKHDVARTGQDTTGESRPSGGGIR